MLPRELRRGWSGARSSRAQAILAAAAISIALVIVYSALGATTPTFLASLYSFGVAARVRCRAARRDHAAR